MVSSPHLVQIDKLVAGGDGITRLDDGRVVFVPEVLPGERVEISLAEQKKDFGRGEVLSIVEPSKFRRVPPCPHVEQGCGGCDWQHATSNYQRELKLQVLVEQLERFGQVPNASEISSINAVEPSESNWRTRIREF